jgi:hypothetical protein
VSRFLRWIAAFLGIGSDCRARKTYEDALYEIRHRSARYY